MTEGEWRIVKTVWEHEPVTAPAVQELLERETAWSYSTVKTLMDRMVGKGILETERLRNLVLYRAAISRKSARRTELLRTLKLAFDGALSPMVRLLLERRELSEEELEELEELLRSKRRKGQRRGAS